MKMIGRVTMLVLACLGASGCASLNPRLVEGGNCTQGSKLPEAIVLIYEDARTGMPAASPEACYIVPGGKVTFVTKVDVSVGFAIDFDKGDGTPAANGQNRFVGAPQRRGGFLAPIDEVREYRPDGKNKYRYSIVIGDKKTDPSIIIDQ